MKKPWLLILVVMLLCLGCRSTANRLRPLPPIVSGITIIPKEAAEDYEVIKSVNRHAIGWETHFGRKLPSGIIIEVLPEGVDEFISPGGIRAIGHVTDTGMIRVIRTGYIGNGESAEDGLPALFHEFCHLAPPNSFYGPDGNHLNPAWASWTAESFRISRLQD